MKRPLDCYTCAMLEAIPGPRSSQTVRISLRALLDGSVCWREGCVRNRLVLGVIVAMELTTAPNK